MSSKKDCEPKCSGRCNKNKKTSSVEKADKACDRKCTGPCSKRSCGTSSKDRAPSSDSSASASERFAVVPKQESPIPAGKSAGLSSSIIGPGEITHVILDLDGVILNIELVYEWVIKDIVKKYGIPASEAQRIIDLQDEETARKICKDYKLSVSPQEFLIVFQNIAVDHLRNVQFMPGIEELVKYFLKLKMPIAVASTTNETAFKLKTQKHKTFFDQFEHVIYGGSNKAILSYKYTHLLYDITCGMFSAKPAHKSVLVLAHSAEAASAALQSGMRVAWLPSKYMKREGVKGVHGILNSVKEFDPSRFGLPK